MGKVKIKRLTNQGVNAYNGGSSLDTTQIRPSCDERLTRSRGRPVDGFSRVEPNKIREIINTTIKSLSKGMNKEEERFFRTEAGDYPRFKEVLERCMPKEAAYLESLGKELRARGLNPIVEGCMKAWIAGCFINYKGTRA